LKNECTICKCKISSKVQRCKTCLAEIRKTKEGTYRAFRESVRSKTLRIYKKYKSFINPQDLPIGLRQYHIDHKTSISEAFLLGWTIEQQRPQITFRFCGGMTTYPKGRNQRLIVKGFNRIGDSMNFNAVVSRGSCGEPNGPGLTGCHKMQCPDAGAHFLFTQVKINFNIDRVDVGPTGIGPCGPIKFVVVRSWGESVNLQAGRGRLAQ